MFSIRLRLALAAAAVTLATSPARSQDPAAAWRQLTVADVEAAHALLRDNHPGAVAEVADTAFERSLAGSRATALERAGRVTNWEGYVAVMQGMAYGMGDKHIWFNPTQQAKAFRWAGAIVSRRGDDWVISGGDSSATFNAPIGATLIACDGVPIAQLAQRRLGETRAVWSVEAQQIAAAPLLLVDDGNPFAPLPAECLVRRGDATTTWSLTWRTVTRTALLPLVAQGAPTGAPGFGVRRFAGGWWIAMQSLNAQAGAVVDTLKGMVERLRAEPMIVVDVRGNGGGNSAYGQALARQIYGDAYVGAVLQRIGGGGEGCGTVFRASADNVTFWEGFVARQRAAGNHSGAESFAGAVGDMKQAIAEGRPMSGPVCPPSARPRAAATGEAPVVPGEVRAQSLYPGRVVLLTDHACFSSCLLLTELFRALGAVHVGMSTDAATHYMEVREADLPSGLGKFSTLMKVSLGMPRLIGPYRPDRVYPGNIAETQALEEWVAGTVGRAGH